MINTNDPKNLKCILKMYLYTQLTRKKSKLCAILNVRKVSPTKLSDSLQTNVKI